MLSYLKMTHSQDQILLMTATFTDTFIICHIRNFRSSTRTFHEVPAFQTHTPMKKEIGLNSPTLIPFSPYLNLFPDFQMFQSESSPSRPKLSSVVCCKGVRVVRINASQWTSGKQSWERIRFPIFSLFSCLWSRRKSDNFTLLSPGRISVSHFAITDKLFRSTSAIGWKRHFCCSAHHGLDTLHFMFGYLYMVSVEGE